MTTIAMLRVHVTLFFAIGATWCGLSACGEDGGAKRDPPRDDGGAPTDGAPTDGAGDGERHWKIQSVPGGGLEYPDLIVGDDSYHADTGPLSTRSRTRAPGGGSS